MAKPPTRDAAAGGRKPKPRPKPRAKSKPAPEAQAFAAGAQREKARLIQDALLFWIVMGLPEETVIHKMSTEGLDYRGITVRCSRERAEEELGHLGANARAKLDDADYIERQFAAGEQHLLRLATKAEAAGKLGDARACIESRLKLLSMRSARWSPKPIVGVGLALSADAEDEISRLARSLAGMSDEDLALEAETIRARQALLAGGQGPQNRER